MAEYEAGVSTAIFDGTEPGEHLRAVGAAGLGCVELTKNVRELVEDGSSSGELLRAAEETGVRINSLHVPFSRELDISNPDGSARGRIVELARLYLRRAKELGARCIVLHPSAEPISDGERAERFRLSRGSLEALAPDAGASGVTVAVECLPRTCLGHTSEEQLRLLKGLDENLFGVCLDVNHANLREDVVRATRAYGRRIVSTHISDNDGLDERHWLPGKGIIPWREWVAALREADYAGPLIYEVGGKAFEGLPDEERPAAVVRNLREVLGV